MIDEIMLPTDSPTPLPNILPLPWLPCVVVPPPIPPHEASISEAENIPKINPFFMTLYSY